MKKIMVIKRISILLTLLFLISFTGKNLSAQYNYMGSWDNDGVPDYLLANGDSISPAYILALNITLPESYSVPIYNPQYIAAGVDSETFCIDTTDVWVTYMDEGATFLNTIGYFTYPIGNPPASISESDITVILPNASNFDGGGGLFPGDKVHIGQFLPGTAIGWVLIADGYDENTSTVYQKPLRSTFYSNPDWNPEPDPSIRKHNVIFKDTVNEVYVVGFEDIRRDSTDGHPYNGCDDDFNDVVFLVAASTWASIDTGNYVPYSGPGGGVTGGGGSGVESNGTLAQHIALRDYMRLKNDDQIDFEDKAQLPNLSKYIQNNIANGDGPMGDELLNFIPQTSVGNTVAHISTPVDLLGITNAISIFAVDYYNDQLRLGAMLATETENGIYEHTKVICDRLAGATLEEINHTTVDGVPFIMYKLTQPNGSVEYASGFTAYVNGNNFEIDNHWTIGEYETRPVNYNFQVWSSTENMTRALMTDVLILMKDYGFVTYLNTVEPDIPKVYVRSGKYVAGEISLEIANTNSASEVSFIGTKAASETSQREDIYFVENVTGASTQSIVLNTGGLFDVDLAITNNVSGEIDLVYFADGTWGLDYVSTGATINYYEVTPENNVITPTSDYYQVERNINISGNYAEYVSIFRELTPSQSNVTLSDYNAVEFTAFGTDEQVMITLVNPNIPLWNQQFRSFVNISSNSDKFVIPLSSFSSSAFSNLNPDEVVTIVFTVEGDGTTWKSFDVSINNVAFTDGAATGVEENEIENVNVYPNPFSNTTNIYFTLEESSSVSINIHDITGRLVHTEKSTYNAGKQHYQFNKGSLENGVYFCEILHGNTKTKTKLIIQ